MSKRYHVKYVVALEKELREERNRYIPKDYPEFDNIDDAIDYLEAHRHIRDLAIEITDWVEVKHDYK